MIPNRNKAVQPSTGSFTLEHEHAQRQVVTAIQVSGTTAIVAAVQPGLMAYYVPRMLEQLSELEPGQAPKIRKLPADRDGILAALNQRLGDIELAKVTATEDGDKHRTREVWVYESLTTFKADSVCFAAKIIRQFKAAGISLIVSATPGETNAAALKKLMHSCKAKRWDFAAPTQEQCDSALQQAAHSDSFGVVQSAIRDMGMMANLPAPSEVLDFPKKVKAEPSLDSDLDVQQLLKAQRKQNKQRQQQSLPPQPQAAPRRRFVGLQLVAGIAFIALVVAVQLDGVPNLFGGAQSANSEPAAAAVETTEIASAVSLDPVIPEVATASIEAPVALIDDAPVAMAAADEQELLQIFAAAPALDAPVVESEQSIATRPTVVASQPAVKQSAPVADKATESTATTAVKPNGIYVQHGAFSQLQGALVWQSNHNNERETKIFTKGSKPKRFVVVSGPFADRQRAENTLGSSSDAFLVPAHLIGEEVFSVGSL